MEFRNAYEKIPISIRVCCPLKNLNSLQSSLSTLTTDKFKVVVDDSPMMEKKSKFFIFDIHFLNLEF